LAALRLRRDIADDSYDKIKHILLNFGMALSRLLIHKESQFSARRKEFSAYAGCANHVNLQQITNNLIVILTTQRTGSTLLCQDLESALKLNYSPTESFIPILTGFSKQHINTIDMGLRIGNILQSFKSSNFTVIKLMMDYVGWLGFFCADKDFALNASYRQLSLYFIENLKCVNATNFYSLVRLDRKNKLKQALSRFINSTGLPTHIKTEKDAIEFEKLLEAKLNEMPDYHCMVIDQLAIILRQIRMLDECLSSIKDTKTYCCFDFENDLLKNKDHYLSRLLGSTISTPSVIKRSLIPTSGIKSKEVIKQLQEIISYDA